MADVDAPTPPGPSVSSGQSPETVLSPAEAESIGFGPREVEEDYNDALKRLEITREVIEFAKSKGLKACDLYRTITTLFNY